MSPNNSNITKQTESTVLRFNLQGELLLWQFDGAETNGEPVDKLLQQGRMTAEQLKMFGVVWVPTQQMVLTEVSVPAKRLTELQAALPYVLEERLSDVIENYHFAILHKQSAVEGTRLQVAVVSKALMQQWYKALKQLELDSCMICADCFALPFQEQNKESNDQILRTFSFPQEDIRIFRNSVYGGFAAPQALQEIILHAEGVSKVEMLPLDQGLWQRDAYTAMDWAQLRNCNLAVGEFSLKPQQNPWKQWLWPNLAAMLVFSTLLTSMWLDKQQALEDSKIYLTQSENLFKQMFPDVKRVVSIKTQTMTRLKKPAQAEQGAYLMPLVYQLEPVFAKQSQVQISALNWQRRNQQAKLTLNLNAKQSAQLQALHRQIQQASQLQAQLSVENVTPEMAQGELNVVAN